MVGPPYRACGKVRLLIHTGEASSFRSAENMGAAIRCGGWPHSRPAHLEGSSGLSDTF